jgi:hypothetical protein
MINGSPDATAIANSENIKITGFTFDGNNTSTIFFALNGESGITGTKPYRYYVIGNNKFQNQAPGTSDGVITAANANNNGQLRGVIYGNTFDRCDIWVRAFSNNDPRESNNTAFNQLAFGTEDNLYIENNTIKWSSSYAAANPGWTETGQGSRTVFRFNTYTFSNLSTYQEIWDIHGFQNWNGSVNSGQTGTMISERYDNTFTGGNQFRWIDHRGGWGMFFDNTWTGSNPSVQLYGMSTPGSCPSQINPAPTTYNPLVNNTYFFNNFENGTLIGASMLASGDPTGCTVTENNSASVGSLGATSQGGWWNEQTSFNGTVGVGRGTKASMPSTCTTGVGFWVTDEGSWNTNLAANTSGRFYKCTATNTWTLYYTPLTYPHPLRTGSQAAAPSPPTNLAAVVQ